MAAKQLSDGNPTGTTLGQSASDLISFHGVDPVAQQAVVTNTSGTLGDTNAAVDAINAVLQAYGLTAS